MADGIDWYKNYERDKDRNRKMPPPQSDGEEPDSVMPMQDIAKQRLLRMYNEEEGQTPVSLRTAR
jgi:hypothetical protein